MFRVFRSWRVGRTKNLVSDIKLKPLSAFEWATVARYIIYISSVAGLSEISQDRVVHLPLSRLGHKRATAQKTAVKGLLEGNEEKVKRFVEAHRGELESGEISVLYGLCIQIRHSIETVEEHLRIIKLYQKSTEASFFEESEASNDDLPF